MKTINELKAKIEKMKKRHVQAMRLACDSPSVTPGDRKFKQTEFDIRDNSVVGEVVPQDESLFMQEPSPSLRCSVIQKQGSNVVDMADKDVNWNDLLVRESFPDDYGTIRPSDTHRERNESIKAQTDEIVEDFN